MTCRDDVEQRVAAVLCGRFRVAPEALRPEAELAALGLDSLDRIELVFELERAFGVEITDAEARAVRTLGDILARARQWAETGSAP